MMEKKVRRYLVIVLTLATSILALGGQHLNAQTISIPAPGPPASEKVGVPECDDFIVKYDACVYSKMPEPARAQFKLAINQWRVSWKKLADNPATRGSLAAACKQATAQQQVALNLYGCLTLEQFTLEQVMSSPFPSELTISKRGDKIAWAFDAGGKRNIWIAEAPAFDARQLTHYHNDDGQELTDLLFSPDGGRIAYVRGGDA